MPGVLMAGLRRSRNDNWISATYPVRMTQADRQIGARLSRLHGGSSWTRVIGSGLSVYLKKRIDAVGDASRWKGRTGAIQAGELRGLLEKAKGTEVGREGGFAKLLGRDDRTLVEAYRDALPLADYERYRERLARTREHAEPDVCWPGVVMDWAQTSGTTGGEKYIPVSREMMSSNRRAALDIFVHAKRNGVALSRLFGGKLVFLGGCSELTENEHGVRTGDLSGLVTRLISFPLDRVYEPGADIALMSDWPKKISAIADRCMTQDVRFVSGMASWSLLLYEQLVERARAEGRIPKDGTLRDLWRNFTLYVHGGVRYPPFDARVRRAWSGSSDVTDPMADVPGRIEVYPASEGFIAVQDVFGDPSLRLHADNGIFFEFAPVEQIDPDNPDDWDRSVETFGADEVEKGQRYVVVMSTNAGLWRYVIGDVVEFDTLDGEGAPRLRIVGRHRHFINAFGENLIVEEIENAAVAASGSTGVRIGEFTASPVYPGEGRSGGLELVIEWDGDARLEGAFAEAFDAKLKEQNVDYTTKRGESFGMTLPTISTVPMGVFSDWMASRGKLGGQNKVPRCANHRDFVEGIKQLIGVRS